MAEASKPLAGALESDGAGRRKIYGGPYTLERAAPQHPAGVIKNASAGRASEDRRADDRLMMGISKTGRLEDGWLYCKSSSFTAG